MAVSCSSLISVAITLRGISGDAAMSDFHCNDVVVVSSEDHGAGADSGVASAARGAGSLKSVLKSLKSVN
ncbi:hypothetical protein NDU88_002996 [Pleurodeles waltl]|uniref:Uncharacterized protein n=1 Tax=Pleurodeles waltl TaxID=8319 RepID=A0AAV7LHI9_PLEWA|nr:hypothetical protein NDU88_002996 [Pleurodeles waltl]